MMFVIANKSSRVANPYTPDIATASQAFGAQPLQSSTRREIYREGKRLPGSIKRQRVAEQENLRPDEEAGRPIFPGSSDSVRRQRRQSITMKVRISPPWQNPVKTASGKPRMKNFTSGASFWPVGERWKPPSSAGCPGRLSWKHRRDCQDSKNTSPNRAICGTTV